MRKLPLLMFATMGILTIAVDHEGAFEEDGASRLVAGVDENHATSLAGTIVDADKKLADGSETALGVKAGWGRGNTDDMARNLRGRHLLGSGRRRRRRTPAPTPNPTAPLETLEKLLTEEDALGHKKVEAFEPSPCMCGAP